MLSSKPSFDCQRAMPKNSNKRWTPEEDKRLLELAATGSLHVMIGAELGRSGEAITGRLGVRKTRANNANSLNPDEGS
jgi:hypothetical protein